MNPQSLGIVRAPNALGPAIPDLVGSLETTAAQHQANAELISSLIGVARMHVLHLSPRILPGTAWVRF